jgi:hypothetical protein
MALVRSAGIAVNLEIRRQHRRLAAIGFTYRAAASDSR